MCNLKNDILYISKNYYKDLLKLPNVIGVGLGSKKINNINTFEPCIHVLVEEKIHEMYLSSDIIIPKTYMGIKTDVIKIGKITERAGDGLLPDKKRPLEAGYGISNEFGGTGTITCIVKKRKQDQTMYFILSNNHVLAGYNKFAIGSAVTQPSQYDDATPDDIVARLYDFVPLIFKSNVFKATNYVDCAIAKIIDNSIISDKIAYSGKVKGVDKAVVDEDITKVGTTSGLSFGTVETIGTSIEVSYDSGTKTAFFKDQIIAYIDSDPGDSGSAVLNSSNKIIGLLFSGTEANAAICNDFETVLNTLKVEVYMQ